MIDKKVTKGGRQQLEKMEKGEGIIARSFNRFLCLYDGWPAHIFHLFLVAGTDLPNNRYSLTIPQ